MKFFSFLIVLPLFMGLSFVDLTEEGSKVREATADEVNAALKAAAEGDGLHATAVELCASRWTSLTQQNLPTKTEARGHA